MLDSAAVFFMKPVKISEVKRQDEENHSLVVMLENLLSLAREGEIMGFTHFALKRGGRSQSGTVMVVSGTNPQLQMVGGMQLLMHEIVSDISAESEVVCLEIDGDETQE